MLALTALSACCVVLAACGGGDSTGETVATESVGPEPAETIAEFAVRYEEATAAVEDGDCAIAEEFNEGAGFTLPCPFDGEDYDEVEITATDEFGTAGVVDYTSALWPDGATAIAARHEDGRFRLIQSLAPSSIGLSSEQVGTEPAETEVRDQVVADFVDAVREQDCDTYFQLALTPTQNKEKECRLEFSTKSQITPDLEANPDATAEPLGSTEAFGFYGLETADNYRVILAFRNVGPDDEATHDDGYRIVTYRSQD